MMQLGAWLLALIGPLVVRGILALGFTTVTFVGVTALVNQLVGYAQTYWSSTPATILALASLSGIPECLGMIFGALMSLFTMWTTTAAMKFVLKGKS